MADELIEPRQPTSAECDRRAPLGDGWYAIWYPQMGGYVGLAAVYVGGGDTTCFEVMVWHNGEFPFDDDGYGPGERNPAHLHHCDPQQFIRFGEAIDELQCAAVERRDETPTKCDECDEPAIHGCVDIISGVDPSGSWVRSAPGQARYGCANHPPKCLEVQTSKVIGDA